MAKQNSSMYTEEEWLQIQDSICKELTVSEFEIFKIHCNKSGLDPVSKQIYPVKRFNKQFQKKVMVTQTGIDGYRAVAERSGKYNGQTKQEWCGKDGIWCEIWMPSETEKYPFAARSGIFKKGAREPTYAVAHWEEYFPKKDNFLWVVRPAGMISKCSETLALRKSFPQDLSGIYTEEEMAQADNLVEDTPEQLRQDKANKIALTNHKEEPTIDKNLVIHREPEMIKENKEFPRKTQTDKPNKEEDEAVLMEMIKQNINKVATKHDGKEPKLAKDNIGVFDEQEQLISENILEDLRKTLVGFTGNNKTKIVNMMQFFFGKGKTTGLTFGEAVAWYTFILEFEGEPERLFNYLEKK